MLRYGELGLFLAPFALYAAWWLLGARVSGRLLAAGVALLVLLALATAWFGLGNRLPAGRTYAPAEWRHGIVEQGHGR
jgi:hypothetical protein